MLFPNAHQLKGKDCQSVENKTQSHIIYKKPTLNVKIPRD